MHDSTLDLFCNHDSEIVVDTFSDVVDDQDHIIQTMQETLFNAMNKCALDGRPDDAVSIYDEWVVDGIEPEDGHEFQFLQDLTEDAE
ncbi:hypothetical protein PSSM7_069 [Prochlorococcus phage P-SSM7]|uniref:Uncharacterized protein n=1 Tax=Prochlorococcus phage P-SSM7 TaxID=445688 RepID=E3SNI7_9CAUD|nr:hypothetical protein PSSM7_069 [Prochlorococcus phage P-SSM7]ADO99034.1 hypothetical protein PSSM7_069 [Prochlorococcus phage P-SSM7]